MKNLQGDIVAIADVGNTIVARYSYDAWGKCTVVSDSTAVSIATVNPYRYRGYYYDAETGLYYLQSRYYDAEVGRFLSVDTNTYEGIFDKNAKYLQYNVFVFCANNPIVYKDDNGKSITLTCIFIGTAIGLVAGAIGGNIFAKSKKNLSPEDGWDYWKHVVGFSVIGGIIGALIGWGAGALITKYSVAKAASSIVNGGGARFSSFDALKRSLGPAGKNRHWHHIVEQCQSKVSRSNFSKYWINNSNNVINIPDTIHNKISSFYSSIPNQRVVNTGGKVFREWITNKSFQEQYKWGIWVIKHCGGKI